MDRAESFATGVGVGLIIALFIALAVASTYSEPTVYDTAVSALTECELTLPRDQHCEITATVKREV